MKQHSAAQRGASQKSNSVSAKANSSEVIATAVAALHALIVRWFAVLQGKQQM